MKRERIAYIIKATATKLSRPDYFEAESERKLWDLIRFLEDDWESVEYKEIKKRDSMLEGIISRCSLGSKAQRENLQAYYNAQ